VTRTEADSEEQASGRSYRCPYCPAEYPTEMLARVHVSYAGDSTHEGRDGMTPEVEPVECDASGERVGTAFTLAGQLNLHGLSLSDIPAAYDGRTFDERERRALLVAAFNANRTLSGTELQDRVTAHLAECDLDPLSVRELGDLCEHVFCPQADAEETASGEGSGDGSPEIRTAETALRDLTALQQAILLAHLARPESDRTEIAAQVGTARSYPTQVINARPDLVARLRSRLERTSLERLVAERVPGEDLADIVEEGHLDAFEVDLQAAQERKRRRNGPTGASPPDATGGQSTLDPDGDADTGDANAGQRESDRDWNADTDEDATAGRAESDPDGDADATGPGKDTAGPEETPTGTGQQERGAAGEHTTGASTRDGEPVPRAEVEAVREQVAFDLAVVEQEMELADPTPQQVRTKAYLEQILERLDDILS
jgi:hypothetical protein